MLAHKRTCLQSIIGDDGRAAFVGKSGRILEAQVAVAEVTQTGPKPKLWNNLSIHNQADRSTPP